MKFAVLALAGSVGMGLSILASSFERSYSDPAQFYAVAGFVVMAVGTFAIVYPPMLEWWEKRKQPKSKSK